MSEESDVKKEGWKSFWLYPRWLEREETGEGRIVLFLLAALVGVLGGLGAVGFKELSTAAQRFFIGNEPNVLDAALALPWYWRIGVPTIGGILAGLVLYLSPEKAKGHGVSEIMEAVTIRRGVLHFRGALVRSFSSLMSIGTGASIGREGPIVQISAATASKVGQFLRVSKDNASIIVGCGVAAGLAAAYNAPIAASFFVMEIIIGNFAIDIFAPLVISSVASTMVYRRMFGNAPVYGTPHFVMVSGWEVIVYVLLGVLTGIAAVLFRRALDYSDKQFHRIPVPGFVKTTIGGLIIGIIGLSWPHVWGNGYHEVNMMLGNEFPIGILIILFVMKLTATSVSVGSGASGGVFTPTQFLGATLGGSLGYIAHAVAPDHVALPSAYALVGMGCLIAGTTYAPIMAIMMIFEMTLNYEIILPLMLSCILSSTIARHFARDSIYTEKLRKRGIRYDVGLEETAMRGVHVIDLMRTDAPVIQGNTRLREVIHQLLRSRSNQVYVVDDNGAYLGAIDIHDLKEFFNEEMLHGLVIARDIVVPTSYVMPNQSLIEVMDHLYLTDADQIPVVESLPGKKFIGVISRRDIIGAYNREVLKKKMLLAKFVTKEKEREGIDYVEMPAGYRLGKVPVSRNLESRTLGEVNFRTRYRLQALEVIRAQPDGKSQRVMAEPDIRLHAGDSLIVIGTDEDFQEYQKLVCEEQGGSERKEE